MSDEHPREILDILLALAPPGIEHVWADRDRELVRFIPHEGKSIFSLSVEGMTFLHEAAEVTVGRTYTHALAAHPDIDWESNADRWPAISAEVARVIDRAKNAG